MTDEEITTAFITLFAGRTDAYGTWGGGKADNHGHPHTPLVNHLYDGPYIGVYPVSDDNTCNWGCVDIDGKDFPAPRTDIDSAWEFDWVHMWELATRLQDTLTYKNVTSWLERTAHGIHLWTFTTTPVPATIMRHALLVACQVADYKPKEVNPKQAQVDVAKPYGNYVRLPYYGALVHGTPKDRFVIDEDGLYLTVEQFCRSSMGSRNDLSLLEHMADLYTPPAPTASALVDVDGATEEAFQTLYPILPTVVRMIFQDGPLGGDRSAAIVKTAVIMRDEGFTAQSVYTVLSALDNRLGKFTDRPDREEQLLKIVNKVGLTL